MLCPEHESLNLGMNKKDQAAAHEQEINLQQLVVILKKRFFYLIAVFLSVLLLAFAYSSQQVPLYKAVSMIIVEPKDRPPVDFVSIDTGKEDEFIETQKKIITSRKVIRKVADKLNLPEETGANAVRKTISVDSVKKTYLLEIKAVSSDPAEAALYANTLAEEYIKYNLEDRRSSSISAFTWLSEQVKELKVKVKKSEMDVLKYKQEEKLASPLEERQSIVNEKIAEMNNQYSEIALQRMEKESVLRELKGVEKEQKSSKLKEVPAFLENSQIQFLKKEYNRIELYLAKVETKFKPKHPEVIRLTSQLSHVRKRIVTEVEKIKNDLLIEYRIIQDREENITDQIKILKQESMQLVEQAIQYGLLNREAESNRQMYDVLLERLKETDIGGSIVSNNIRVIDKAQVPKRPFKPSIPRNMLFAAVIGLFLGTVLCFLIEYFDHSFKDGNDVLSLDLSLLGNIPHNKALKKNKITSQLERLTGDRSYEECRMILNFHRKEGSLKSFLVTSTVQGEGKTTSVVSLAILFAKTGTKVLIVDADMITAGLSRIFSTEKEPGLAELVAGNKAPAELIQKTALDNLYLLPFGSAPADPTELLGSDAMKQFLDNIKKDFDLVLIDGPPASMTLGAALLANFTDRTIFIVKSNSTARAAVNSALDTLKKLRANIIGVILTGMK
ncbi:MAG: polysaccharide biosynthesis tyrosine autokinase [Candidatus Electrothrix sp. GM3_4]|nr:polysaccharide biosynthesis tyrosine autokinase [Candidatus Electrothrix sp. GM3_4]